MNERQNMVVATTVSGLILVVVFLCPWRIESTGELRWSPIYQPPLSYVESYDADYGSRGHSKIASRKAHRALGILLLEVGVLFVVAGGLYLFFASSEEDEEVLPHRTDP